MRDFALYCEKKLTESLTLVDNRDEREGHPLGEEEEEKFAKQQKQQQIMLIYNNFAVIE